MSPTFRPAALAAAVLCFSSCPIPISNTTFTQVSDKTPPVVDIISPADNSTYTQIVVVNGTAVDSGGRVKNVTWTVTGTLGTLAAGTVDAGSIGASGAYSIQFGTLSFSGPIAVTVTAIDWNDNAGQASRTLAAPTSALSSFTASTASKSVTLNWDAVPGAVYTLIYTNNGTIPSLSYGKQVSVSAPPYTLVDLSNGSMCVFLLRAQVDATTYWSDYVRAIPLSLFTVAPVVTGGYHFINLEWNPIAATSQFQIERALSPQGPWTNYTGTVTSTSYVDTSVSDDTWYYYRVSPSLMGAMPSTFNGAQTLRVPTNASSAIASLTTSGAANKVRVYGTYAFVAADTAGVLVIDVRNPKAPVQVAALPTAKAMDICIDQGGQYAYVADDTSGLRVIDISNPLNPADLGHVLTGATYTRAIAVSEIVDSSAGKKITYVLSANPLNSQTAVFIVDVTTASSPVLQPYSFTPGSTYIFTDVAATYYGSDRRVYAASGGSSDGQLVLLQDNGTSSISVIGSYNDTAAKYKANQIYVKQATSGSDYVYAAGESKEWFGQYVVRVFSLSATPAVVGTSAYKTFYNSHAYDITARGNTVLVSDGIGLQLVDVSNPSSPTMGAFWTTPGVACGIDAQSGSSPTFAVTAGGALGLCTVDLAQPVSPTFAGSQPGNAVYGAAVRGGYAYVSETPSGGSPKFQVLDVSNPAVIVERGSYSVGGMHGGGVVLSGHYAFLADGDSGLRVIDITNPSLPSFVSLTAPIASTTNSRIAIKGDYVYVAANGLEIYDISNPTVPLATGLAKSEIGFVSDVTLRGQLAYMVDGQYFQPNSLEVIDVSRPALPARIASTSTGVILYAVAIYGDYAFLADATPGTGLLAVNIDSSSANYMKAYGPAGTSSGMYSGVAAYGNWAFVAAGFEGFAIVDISSPSALAATKVVTTTNFSGQLRNGQSVALSGSYAFISDSNPTAASGGLVVARIAP